MKQVRGYSRKCGNNIIQVDSYYRIPRRRPVNPEEEEILTKQKKVVELIKKHDKLMSDVKRYTNFELYDLAKQAVEDAKKVSNEIDNLRDEIDNLKIKHSTKKTESLIKEVSD